MKPELWWVPLEAVTRWDRVAARAVGVPTRPPVAAENERPAGKAGLTVHAVAPVLWGVMAAMEVSLLK